MPRVGFEPTIQVFERAKTVHDLDRAATVVGYVNLNDELIEEVRMVSAVQPRDKSESGQLVSAVKTDLRLSTSACVVSECTVQRATHAHVSHGLSAPLQTSPTLLSEANSNSEC
jgi:hypothetical protein